MLVEFLKTLLSKDHFTFEGFSIQNYLPILEALSHEENEGPLSIEEIKAIVFNMSPLKALG